MQFGHFDDANREYVIETPRTPLPWINYLGSEDFFTILSNTAGGYAFYRDARLRRLTRYRYNNSPLDSDGFHIYIKDENTKDGSSKDGSTKAESIQYGSVIWNIAWQPVQTELEYYECRHGLGYSVFTGEKNGIRAQQEMMVPLGDSCLLCRVSVRNTGSEEKTIDIFPYTEFCLWDAMDDSSNFQRNYSIGEVETEPGVIYHKTEYRERRNHYAQFWSSRIPDGFDTSRDAFIGVYGSPAHPEAVFGSGCTGSIAHGWAPVGAMQFHMTLKPGQEESFLLGLGYIENAEDDKWEDPEKPGIINKKKAEEMRQRYATEEQYLAAKQALAAKWDDLLGNYQVECGDEKLCRMVNIWNQYQCMVTFNMSRSASYYESGMGRGMGFRDSCQDLLGFVHMIPERARERILDIAATQFPDGSAYHQYQPLTKKGNLAVGSGFNDDPLWLIAGTDAYIRETGDWSILEESVAFDCDMSAARPLMEHLRRSFRYTVTHLGPHRLPLIGRADWNDCLNLNCFSAHPGESFQITGPSEGPVAESVFIGGMFVKYGRAYTNLCRHLGLEAEAVECEKRIAEMEEAVLDAGWDGDWFRRAYDAFGKPVGSAECDEGKIFIEPQGMCVMAGIGVKTGEAARALKSVERYLDTKYGIVLLNPAYTSYRLNLGEISSYPPGYKENAGIFCHNNPWIVCAETVLGHGSRAFDLYCRTAPAYIEGISEIHRTEPYVYSQMVAGKDAPTFGEAKNSWLTGTAAWTLLSVTQAILGVTPELDGLRIDPCIPAELKEFSVTRRFRGAEYRITVENPDGVEKGVKRITVNGQEIHGQAGNGQGADLQCACRTVVPLFEPGTVVDVRAVMG